MRGKARWIQELVLKVSAADVQADGQVDILELRLQIGFQWVIADERHSEILGSAREQDGPVPDARGIDGSQLTAASTSQKGVAITGMKRRGSGAIHSMSQSL